MSRPRKPTSMHLLTGAIDHDPQRFRDRLDEPRDDRALGPPPDAMRPEQRAAWLEIERLAPWLRYCDRLAVEIAAALLVTFRIMGAGGMAPAALSRLQAALGALGLTPSDRSKVTMPPAPRSTNRFANIGKRPA